MNQGGLSFIRYSINTAEYGDYSVGKRIINEDTQEMKGIRGNSNGTFAKNWILENQANQVSLKATRKKEQEHPIEK